ncbi:MAG: energy-coupled thiamine transporter ThiT [Firmicutes bacterium]|nr:energy-coupled thiamine transporter ThiT [Bacillota bacterium]
MNRFRELFAHILGVHPDFANYAPSYRVALIIAGIAFIGTMLITIIVLTIQKHKHAKKVTACTLAGTAQFILTYILMVFIESITTSTQGLSTGLNTAVIWSTLIVASLLIIVGVLVANFIKSHFKTFACVAILVLLVHSAVILSAMIGNFISRDDRGLTAQQTGYQVVAWVTLALATLLAIAVVIIHHKKGEKLKRNETLSIAFAGVAVAMSFALSYARFWRMPTGGSITFARLVPLAVYAYIFGVKRGLLAGLVWGTLRLFVDPIIVHPVQFILEYPVSFMMIGLVGFVKYLKAPVFLSKRLRQRISWNNRLHPAIAIPIGILLVTIVRYTIHVTSGVIWISAFTNNPDVTYMGNEPFRAILAFSLSINAVQVADAAIAIVAAAIIMISPQMLNLVKRTEQKFLMNNITRNPNPKEQSQEVEDDVTVALENSQKNVQ